MRRYGGLPIDPGDMRGGIALIFFEGSLLPRPPACTLTSRAARRSEPTRRPQRFTIVSADYFVPMIMSIQSPRSKATEAQYAGSSTTSAPPSSEIHHS